MQSTILKVANDVSDKFDNTVSTDKVAAPIEVIVVGGVYTGMTSIGSIIEKALLDAGLSNVVVANPEETQEERLKMVESWRNQNSEEENARFFGKPITIHTARAQFKPAGAEDNTATKSGTEQLRDRMMHFGDQMRKLIFSAEQEGINVTIDFAPVEAKTYSTDHVLGFQDVARMTTVHPVPFTEPNRFYPRPLAVTCQSIVLGDVEPTVSENKESQDFKRVNQHVYLGEVIPPKKL